jgi:hypothetical protein
MARKRASGSSRRTRRARGTETWWKRRPLWVALVVVAVAAGAITLGMTRSSHPRASLVPVGTTSSQHATTSTPKAEPATTTTVKAAEKPSQPARTTTQATTTRPAPNAHPRTSGQGSKTKAAPHAKPAPRPHSAPVVRTKPPRHAVKKPVVHHQAAPKPPAATPAPSRMKPLELHIGMKDAAGGKPYIAQLQWWLHRSTLGNFVRTTPDGVFGPKTQDALARWQRATKKWSPTGTVFVGKPEWEQLAREAKVSRPFAVPLPVVRVSPSPVVRSVAPAPRVQSQPAPRVVHHTVAPQPRPKPVIHSAKPRASVQPHAAPSRQHVNPKPTRTKVHAAPPPVHKQEQPVQAATKPAQPAKEPPKTEQPATPRPTPPATTLPAYPGDGATTTLPSLP